MGAVLGKSDMMLDLLFVWSAVVRRKAMCCCPLLA